MDHRVLKLFDVILEILTIYGFCVQINICLVHVIVNLKYMYVPPGLRRCNYACCLSHRAGLNQCCASHIAERRPQSLLFQLNVICKSVISNATLKIGESHSAFDCVH
jgi:hypothetical protein